MLFVIVYLLIVLVVYCVGLSKV